MDEFKQIIKDALIKHTYDSTLFDGATSEARQDLLVEEIENKIKAKFHIFRINKILTGDSPRSNRLINEKEKP
jgi:hypothetical protein|tara:strand:- start:1551 stop:1769 length:219 start_codon:yes stop_codon:yes gene_type:complete